MSNKTVVISMSLIEWLSSYVLTTCKRIGSSSAFAEELARDSYLFSYWFSLCGKSIDLSEEHAAKVSKARQVKPSLREISSFSKALEKINSVSNPSSIQGLYEAHEVFYCLSLTPEEIIKYSLSINPFEVSTPTHLQEILDVCCGSEAELNIVKAAVASNVFEALEALMHTSFKDKYLSKQACFAFFEKEQNVISELFSKGCPLSQSGLITIDHKARTPKIDEYWTQFLLENNDQSLTDYILEKMEPTPSGFSLSKVSKQDMDIGVSLIKKAGTSPVNVLLYGDATLDKSSLAYQLCNSAKKEVFKLRKYPDSDIYRTACFMAQRLLDKNQALVIEKPKYILSSGPSNSFLSSFFGIDFDEKEAGDKNSVFFESKNCPTIWVVSESASLPIDTLGRYNLHLQAHGATWQERKEMLKKCVESLKVSALTKEEISKMEGLSQLQLETAINTAKMISRAGTKAFEKSLLEVLKRSQIAAGSKKTIKESVTYYDLSYINFAGRFGPSQIIQAFKRTNKGTLCLYGIPGTGKTQFVHYLASELGMPLLCYKASELLSKWLGDSEKNISEMFDKARGSGSVLFLDEGDSFLRDRSTANHSWEVTQVNELLQQMESFNGIFIMATNLFRNLDEAALRRFNFKLEFKELTMEQRYSMFLKETGLDKKQDKISKEKQEEFEESLILMRNLTAGDFATVKKQSTLMGLKLSPHEWLEQLQQEVDFKQKTLIKSEQIAYNKSLSG